MSSGSGGKGSSKKKTRIDIPDFLQPLLTQGADTASDALSNLAGLSATNRVAGFDPLQEEAFDLAAARAGGAGGFIPTAQRELMQTARGVGIDEFVPSFSALSGLANNPISIPPSVRRTLAAAQGGSLPGASVDALTGAAQGVGVNDLSRDTLESTARGDFLLGGQGFDAAVQAAVRAAQPHVASVFGGTAGGIDSGLARAAIGEAATDAFASQFGQERSRQLSAANALAGLDLDSTRTQLGAADTLARLGLADTRTGIDAGLSLAGLEDADLNRGLAAGETLAGLGNAERSRQMGAVAALPEAALFESDILGRIGGQRQALNQLRLDRPLDLQMQLLAASLGGLPISSLLGQTTRGKDKAFSLGFG